MLHFLLTAISIFSANALIPQGLHLNSKLKPLNTEVLNERGFNQNFALDEFEVHVKGTRFTADPAARQMSAVEFANIVKLYSPRGNPYEGQISDLIQCSKIYEPQVFQFKIGEYPVAAVSAGTNERKLFGACAREQISFWAAYFSFYYPPEKTVIEVRLFKKAARPSAPQLAKLNRELQSAARSIFKEPTP